MLENVREELISLVAEGQVCVKIHPGADGRPRFVAVEHATSEEVAYSQKWLETPCFQYEMNS